MIASNGIILVTTMLCYSAFARPQFHLRIPGNEFILRSCIASAELKRTQPIPKPEASVQTSASSSPGNFQSPKIPHEDNDHRIIKINAIPYYSPGKPKTLNEKSYLRINDGTTNKSQEDRVESISDTPLKTVKVRGFQKGGPVIFKEKKLLPQLEHNVSNANSNEETMVIVIRTL